MPDMTNRVAFITGASSGIGLSTAEAFAAQGASVVLAALATEITSRGGQATFIVTAVARAADLARMVAHALTTFERLDSAVNNAANEATCSRIAP